MDEEHLTTTEIKGMILDLFGGGVHTSSATLEWAMAELLRHPECMRRLQTEVDTVMSQHCNGVNSVDDVLVDDDHIQQMPYLQSIVKEVMRLHPILPLIFPRVASTSFNLGKYQLPAGTNVLVNAWAIARDPRYWDRPTEFWPERFSKSDIDFSGQHYQYLPFGAGRRMCPGIRLGLSVVHVTLANLVRHFDWGIPDGKSAKDIDMSCKGGIGNSRAVPLLAIPKRRIC
ncbi:hypothetical protein KP509_23G048700 [Ceratopteris richardii]|nr:hypothetical protein KP509_23G048700 [Ceratopteris richardii]